MKSTVKKKVNLYELPNSKSVDTKWNVSVIYSLNDVAMFSLVAIQGWLFLRRVINENTIDLLWRSQVIIVTNKFTRPCQDLNVRPTNAERALYH